MSSDYQYRQFVEQLYEDFEAIRDRLHALEQADHDVNLEELADTVAAILDERERESEAPEHDHDHEHEHPPGLTEDRVIELIGEYAPAGGGGGDVGEDLRRRLEAMLARLDASLKELEKSLSRVVGPSPEQLTSSYHSTPGWGVHFEVEYPIQLLEATVKANQSGYVNVEVHRYDPVEREPQGLADSTLVGISGEGQHTLELGLEIDSPGHYVLTRDYTGSPVDEDRVALRRTDGDYGGWASDSGEGVTFHGGADAGGRWGGNQLWYYFGDLHIRDAIPNPEPDEDEDGTGDGDENTDGTDGFGEGLYGDGPYGDGDGHERPTFGQ